MKSLFPLALISLTLTSCSLIRSVDSDVTLPIENPPAIIATPEETPIVATPEEDKKPETDKKTPTTNTNMTTPPSGTPKQEEVSTEDLTKELDAFVDDITKGL